MVPNISPAISFRQQPGSWHSISPPNNLREMSQKPHNRNITPADRRATERLQRLWGERAEQLGITQDTVAEILDRSQGLVSQYLRGKLALNFKAVLAFAEALQLEDPAMIRSDLPEQQPAVAQHQTGSGDSEWRDILGYSQALGLGSGAEATEYAETHRLKFRADSLTRKGLHARNLHVYYGKGDSMEPRINDGDAILFDTSDTRPSDGQIFVIQLGREIYAKRCEILDETVYFRTDNPNGDHQWKKPKKMSNPRQPIEILGRVRWIGSWEG